MGLCWESLLLFVTNIHKLRKLIKHFHLFYLLILSLHYVGVNLAECLLETLNVLIPVLEVYQRLQLSLRVLKQLLKHQAVVLRLLILLLHVSVLVAPVSLDVCVLSVPAPDLLLHHLLLLARNDPLLLDLSLHALLRVGDDLVHLDHQHLEEVVEDQR